jgi:hypothetical protein
MAKLTIPDKKKLLQEFRDEMAKVVEPEIRKELPKVFREHFSPVTDNFVGETIYPDASDNHTRGQALANAKVTSFETTKAGFRIKLEFGVYIGESETLHPEWYMVSRGYERTPHPRGSVPFYQVDEYATSHGLFFVRQVSKGDGDVYFFLPGESRIMVRGLNYEEMGMKLFRADELPMLGGIDGWRMRWELVNDGPLDEVVG